MALMAGREYKAWKGSKRQGEPGFLREAAEFLRDNGLRPGARGFSFGCRRPGQTGIQLFPYQQVFAALVRPETPVHRLVVKWRTGSGKTVGMILALDAYFDDPRPKILVFPEKTVEQNFYSEIMQYPSRYRQFLDRQLSQVLAGEAAMKRDWACTNARCGHRANAGRYSCKKCKTLAPFARAVARDLLDLKGTSLLARAGTPGFPGAPLRAMTYNVAGGSAAAHGPRPRARRTTTRSWSATSCTTSWCPRSAPT
jgi:hypothetical protein